MTKHVIAIIGTGNMGTSLIGGLIKSGYPSDKIWGTCPNKEKLEHLHQYFHIHTSTNNIKACESAEVILFAVKPNILKEVAAELASLIQSRHPLIISIVTGIQTQNIQAWLGEDIPIVRAMPNTPALINAGATALYANTLVDHSQRNIAESILRSVGVAVWLQEESLLDIVTAISGSGPAYFFLIMEAMQQIAQKLGLSSKIASLLIKETALGAARMAIESDYSLEELRQKVTSPGCTTEKAVSVLEENQIRKIFKNAIDAAVKRSQELGQLKSSHRGN